MLLPYTSLTYYGPGCSALVGADSLGSVTADIKAKARAAADLAGSGVVTLAKATRLKNRPCTISGQGLITQALPKARARALATIKVNSLSQDDVTGAVLEAVVEGGLSLKQVLRLLLAHAAGDATGLESGSPEFKSQDGSKTRIGGSYAAGTRTVTALDGS